MKWGIIGYGSIGKKHADNISALGDEIFCLTKNRNCPYPTVSSVDELIAREVEFILICNETSKHVDVYKEIRKINQTVPVLVEKPIFDKKYAEVRECPMTFVAYCLRFHPLVDTLVSFLKNEKIISASFYCGQYLPTWRPDRKYTDTYSSQKSLGGGVLRDLSHEIDLASYLIGELHLNYSFNQKVSNLMIDSDDLFVGHFRSPKCPSVVIELNYLDRNSQRYLSLVSNENTYKIDFSNGTLMINGEVKARCEVRSDMLKRMIVKFKSRDFQQFCTMKEGLTMMDLFEQVDLEKEQ